MNPGDAIQTGKEGGVVEVCSLLGTVCIIRLRKRGNAQAHQRARGRGRGAEKGLLEGLPPSQAPESIWMEVGVAEAPVKEAGL